MNILRMGMLVALAALASCGGGGGGGGGSSSSSGGNPAPVRTLFVSAQPSGAAPAAPFATQPVVQVRSNGATDTTDNSTAVTVTIVAGTGTAGAVLTGTMTATAVAGVATFTNLGINTAGAGYQLSFSATGIAAAATSSTFAITAPPARTLAVVTQPQGAASPAQLAMQPVVQVRSNGVLDGTDNTTVVTVSILANTGTAGATLSGTTTATAVGGVATFTNLGIIVTGSNYQLRFTAPGVTETTSGNFSIIAGGAVIPPSTPPASQITFNVDSTHDVRAISRFIYGMNGWDPSVRPANLTLSRSGGNRMTAYNWETNDSNAGADFQNQNDTFLGGGTVPNGAVKPGLEAARAAGAGMLVTMPLIGYVSADHNGGGDVALSGPNYLATRFRVSLPRKGAPFVMAPVTNDGFVYQDEYIKFLDQSYPGAFAAANNPIMINLDNEPDLWQHTHARLRGDGNVATQAGLNATYAEMVQRTVDYADAAKDVAPAAQIFGPVNYGWQGMVRFQDAADANGRDFLEFYLAQMAAAEGPTGHRLVDVLDVHWYPEATGLNATGGQTRVTEDNTDAGVVAARKQAPRSLWDPAYTETSWITGCCSGGPLRLIPRLKDKIAANYPNTKLAITEYNYGGPNHISGGIAQADVLGIFGREGLYAATLWRLSGTNSFIYGGFESFRNYDGANGSFGDTSIRATNSDVATASVYASVNAGNAARMVIVAVNKSDTAQTAGIAVTHTTQFHTAQVYTLTSANSAPQHQ
ncbi:MAG TPA: glycoside hydrolase family 44 protein, partial [Steroidobacteraceae bacterium]|nr:glycoside hydrolase family 44 protein [Steroidobacteraceae bacterium]